MSSYNGRYDRLKRRILVGQTVKAAVYKYEIILYWSDADGVFIAEVPQLPGCAAHGNTQVAALKNVNDAISLWIDTARKFNDPKPEPKGERLMLA